MFPSGSAAQFALIALLAGVGEELLFRGVIQSKLSQWTSPAAGLILASLLFGAAHALSRLYFLLATVIGLYLGWFAQYFGELVTPIVAHSLYDFLALVYLSKTSQRRGRRKSDIGTAITIARNRMNRTNVKGITCTELRELIREQPVEIIDVRTPEEFVEVRAATARNVPLDLLNPHAVMQTRTRPAERTTVLHLPFGRPQRRSVCDVHDRRLRKRHQHRRRHRRLARSGLADSNKVECIRVTRNGPLAAEPSGPHPQRFSDEASARERRARTPRQRVVPPVRSPWH